MFLGSINFVFIIFLTESWYSNVDCQICTERQIVETLMPLTYLYNVRETYRSCYFGSDCIKTRWSYAQSQKYITKTEAKIVEVCCKGYIEDDEDTYSTSIKCNPICMPRCSNGYCINPGECACNTGYIADSTNSHNCLPVCTKGCAHGVCEAPDTCRCEFGYNLLNGTCQPVCTEPCHNGICIEPEHCQCHPGYRKSENNICEPYCSTGCDHGSCIGPETCKCNPGWQITKKNDSLSQSCQPVCTEPCYNGTCVAPDTCTCYPGYRKSDNNKCEPHCFNGCTHPSSSSVTTTIKDIDATEPSTDYDLTSETIDWRSNEMTLSADEVTLSGGIDINDTISYVNDATSNKSTNNKIQNNSANWIQSNWIYVLIALLLIVFVIFSILIITNWKLCLIYLKGSSYVVEDDEPEAVESQFVNITFSSIVDNRRLKEAKN